jgi:hypothetical protein
MKLLLVAIALLSSCTSTANETSPAPRTLYNSADAFDSSPVSVDVEAINAGEPTAASAPEPARAALPHFAEATTVADLCEPVDSRWAFPTKDERKVTIDIIHKVCSAMGTDRRSCDYFARIVSLREASYRPWARSRLPGDRSAAARAYLASAHLYGWEARWSLEAQKISDLSAIELSPIQGRLQNPYYAIPERWISGGLGLGGLNVAYTLRNIDVEAPPEILCDPVINAIVQISIGRAAVERYGASNFYEVQAVYGGRTYYSAIADGQRPLSCSAGECPSDMTYAQRRRAHSHDQDLRRRCEAKGIDCLARPVFGRKHKGDTAAEIHALADEVRGGVLPPWDEPVATSTIVSGFEG